MKRWNKINTSSKQLGLAPLLFRSRAAGNRVARESEKEHGFTILEVTIVLAVSSVLLVAAIVAIGGRQAMTEFQQASREVEHKMQDVASNVAAGLFAIPSGFGCSAEMGGPPVVDEDAEAGQCVFIGKVVQFGQVDAGGEEQKDRFYEAEIIARRLSTTGGTVENLDQALPRTYDSLFTPNRLLFGLEAKTMTYTYTGGGDNIGAIAFMSRLSSADTARSSQIDLYPLIGTQLGGTTAEEIGNAIQDLNADSPSTARFPDMRFTVCFEGGEPNFRAVLTFGGTTPIPSLIIQGGKCEEL